jgi:hypothetical protein
VSHFVCRCGSNRVGVEPLPRGTKWCRLLVTCKVCGKRTQVFAEDVAGVLRFRVSGQGQIVAKGQCVPDPAVTRMSPSDCPASWEFRAVY